MLDSMTMVPSEPRHARSPSDPSGLSLQPKAKPSRTPDVAKIDEEPDSVAISSEVEFKQWYDTVEEDLFEASYEEYQYVWESL